MCVGKGRGVRSWQQIWTPQPWSTACLAIHPFSAGGPDSPDLTQINKNPSYTSISIGLIVIVIVIVIVIDPDLILLPSEAVSPLLLDLKAEASVSTKVKVGNLR